MDSMLLDMDDTIELKAFEVEVAMTLSLLVEFDSVSMLLDMVDDVETGALEVELASAL